MSHHQLNADGRVTYANVPDQGDLARPRLMVISLFGAHPNRWLDSRYDRQLICGQDRLLLVLNVIDLDDVEYAQVLSDGFVGWTWANVLIAVQ